MTEAELISMAMPFISMALALAIALFIEGLL
jgi:hypothetical protein